MQSERERERERETASLIKNNFNTSSTAFYMQCLTIFNKFLCVLCDLYFIMPKIMLCNYSNNFP